MRAQILSYSRTRGLFAGVSLNGATIDQDRDANDRFYGMGYRTGQIVFEGLGGSAAGAGVEGRAGEVRQVGAADKGRRQGPQTKTQTKAQTKAQTKTQTKDADRAQIGTQTGRGPRRGQGRLDAAGRTLQQMAQRGLERGEAERETLAFGVGRQHAGAGGQERRELAQDHSQRERWRGQYGGPVQHASEHARELRAGHRCLEPSRSRS